MAEEIKINFPTENESNPNIDSDLKNQILGFNIKESMDESNQKDEEVCPKEFEIDEYYKNDDLGKSVLEMKYLAPWEKNPWDLWKRQAKALASVEKNKRAARKMGSSIF